MKIDLKPGNDRRDHFYAIKDQQTGKYVNATWKISKDGETCTWFDLEEKVSKLCADETRARMRFAAMLEHLKTSLHAVSRNPLSRWKVNNTDLLLRLINGDLRLVRIEFELRITETPQ